MGGGGGGGGALVGHEQGLGVVGMGLLTNGVTRCSRGLVCRSAGVAAGDGLVTVWSAGPGREMEVDQGPGFWSTGPGAMAMASAHRGGTPWRSAQGPHKWLG